MVKLYRQNQRCKKDLRFVEHHFLAEPIKNPLAEIRRICFVEIARGFDNEMWIYIEWRELG